MLIEKFLFELDLERSIQNFFKEGGDFSLSHNSKITNCEVNYTGAQLMSLFAIEAEIEVNNIIKMKYGNRVKHIGGNDVSDIKILGTPYAFNIKTLFESSGMIKLCGISTPTKLNGLEYRFVTMNYHLSECGTKVIFDKVHVFSWDYIKDIVNLTNGAYYISKGKVLEYVARRDAYAHGETKIFKKLNMDNLKPTKPEIPRDKLLNYLNKKDSFVEKDLISRFKQFNVKSIPSILEELELNSIIKSIEITENESTSTKYQIIKTAEVSIQPTLIEEKIIESKEEVSDLIIQEEAVLLDKDKNVSKLSKAKNAYNLYQEEQLDGVKDKNDFKSYLIKQYRFTKDLASNYATKLFNGKI